MRALPLALLAGFLLSACATTRMSEPEKLALYTSHAGAPVKAIPYRTPIGWDKIDGSHVLITIRPTEGWLFRLAPNCFDWVGSGPSISITNHAGFVSAKFDHVISNAPGNRMRCRIEEMRPVDLLAVRSARDAREASTP